MTVDEHRQVRIVDEVEGPEWHSIARFEDGMIETCCGRLVSSDDEDVEVSEIGDRPRDLSGSTICYSCTSSHAQPQETSRAGGSA